MKTFTLNLFVENFLGKNAILIVVSLVSIQTSLIAVWPDLFHRAANDDQIYPLQIQFNFFEQYLAYKDKIILRNIIKLDLLQLY